MIIIKAVDKIQSHRRYVSGSVSSNGVYTCLAFQGYNEDSGRDYVDVQRTYRNNTEVAVAAKLLTVSFEISAVNDNKMVLWSRFILKILRMLFVLTKQIQKAVINSRIIYFKVNY